MGFNPGHTVRQGFSTCGSSGLCHAVRGHRCKLCTYEYNINIARKLRQVCKLMTTISTREARELANNEGRGPSQKRKFERPCPKGGTHSEGGI
jgi:hypothetical protein